ncbi:MAG: hypothetical protein E5X63_37080, partial [Mesorhizobium sp.]
RPDIVADAQTVGDASVDTDKPPTPDPKPQPVDKAEAPPPAPTPKEKPKPEDVPKPKEQPKPVPATEVAPVPQPKEEVKPEPVKQAEPKPTPAKEPAPTPPQDKTAAIDAKHEVKPDAVAEAIAKEPPTEETQLPDSAPAPQARPKPQPAQAESAKAPERKDADKPVKEASSKPKSEDKQFNADEISALLDKRKPSGGGAKRSTQQASLGGDKTQGAKLSQSELDGLREQIRRCWNVPTGMLDGESLKVSIKMKLTQSGEIDGTPEVVTGGGSSMIERVATEAARRAVLRCAPYNLPTAKFDGELGWNEVKVNFDPSEMY